MLHEIRNMDDEFVRLIDGDPVRPGIRPEKRINKYSRVFILLDDKLLAVTCVKFLEHITRERRRT